MFKKASNNQKWTTAKIEDLYKQIKVLPDDDKCIELVDIAKELINSGDPQNLNFAEAILLKAIRSYFKVDDTNIKALVYFTLGNLYELKEDYIKSYTYYEKYALNNTINEGSHAILLRNLLLRDNFTYSQKLEKELSKSYYDYDLGLRNDRIYEGIAEYLVFQNENKLEKAEEKKNALKALVQYGQLPVLDVVIRKDKHLNALDVPQKVIDFVKAL